MLKALLLCLALPALPAHAATLADDMRSIGKIVKALTASVSDPTKNAASATQAKQLVTLFTDCRDIKPDSIAAMPADQQPKAMADYQSLIQQEIDAATELETAFLQNNNATAKTILADMQVPKAEGHKKYQ